MEGVGDAREARAGGRGLGLFRRLAREFGVPVAGPETLVPVACRCQRADGSRPQHGPHFVPLRRLARGGDLRGRVAVADGVPEQADAVMAEVRS